MVTQYRMSLVPEWESAERSERERLFRFLRSGAGYRMYAALLSCAPQEFGERLHEDGVTPVSQYLCPDGSGRLNGSGHQNEALRLIWTVNLLGEDSEKIFVPVLEEKESWHLHRDKVMFSVEMRERRCIRDVDELLAQAANFQGVHRLQLCTPVAFKQRRQHVALPSEHLVIQNLLRKWNGCITDCPIEDADGEGEKALVEGLQIGRFDIHSEPYAFKEKGKPIRGAVGRIEVENHLDGFHRQIADALLLFSDFAGLGIKTALGMGGIRHR